MILDKNLLFSDDQSLAINVGTDLCTKSIDIGDLTLTDTLGNVLLADPGRGVDIEVECQITTAVVAAGGAATLQVKLVSDTVEALSSPTILASTEAIAKALLVPGYKFRLSGRLPPGIAERYIGLQFVVGTANIDSGNITAGLVLDRTTVFA